MAHKKPEFDYDAVSVDPDAVHAVADEIRNAARLQQGPDAPGRSSDPDPELPLRPPPRPSPPSAWRQRQEAAAERRETLRLAELEAEQPREALRLAELAAEQRARDRETRERDQQQRLVAQINAQRQSELRYAAQVRAARQRENFFADLQQHVDRMVAAANPAPETEPQVVYIQEEQGSPRLGDQSFDPKLATTALRWR